MKPTLYLPMLLMLTATGAQADDKPAPATKQQAENGEKPAGDKAASEKAGAEVDRETLEKEFAKKLTGSALVGHFTTDGKEDEKLPKPDRYELVQVSKLRDDYWVFLARYNDFKLPLTLKVQWAGDTPVLTLTDFTIPAMGTFTCRILFYGDRYSGTWQHGKVGGHMWGKIEPAKPADTAAEKKEEAKPPAPKNGQPKAN